MLRLISALLVALPSCMGFAAPSRLISSARTVHVRVDLGVRGSTSSGKSRKHTVDVIQLGRVQLLIEKH